MINKINIKELEKVSKFNLNKNEDIYILDKIEKIITNFDVLANLEIIDSKKIIENEIYFDEDIIF